MLGAWSYHTGIPVTNAKEGKYFDELKEISLVVPNLVAASAKFKYDFTGRPKE